MLTRPEDYTVGWICAIPTEFVAACELLDEEYGRDRIPRVDTQRNKDTNSYKFGRIHEHNIVIACLPKGRYGLTSAAVVAERMRWSFPSIRFGLMVGIAGGAPSKKHDIRLGDVVVSSPTPMYGSILQYDFGKAMDNHIFEETGHSTPPPDILLNAMASLETEHKRKGHRIVETLANMLVKNRRLQPQYSYPGEDIDKLYETSSAGQEQLVKRVKRGHDEDNPCIHYGLIASANQLMKNREARDALISKRDVLCFEMEAAGLMNNFPCLVIRGICDYSDMHKNDDWQGYAAATAAAYAKELLEIIPGEDISSMLTAEEVSHQPVDESFRVPFNLEGIPTAKKFIDRSNEMQKLEDTLLPNNNDKHRKIFVLRGLGGIGKTQLAARFVRLHQDKFSAIFWLNGGSRDSVEQSLAKQVDRLPNNQSSAMNKMHKTTGTEAIDVAAKEFLGWLAIPTNNNWLLIYDNVDRAVHLSDPLSYDIKRYFPTADHGSILITTRLTRMEQLGDSEEVKRVDEAIARSIFESWYKSAYDESVLSKLLIKLDGLPLAIAQAGAFLQSSGLSVETYLRMYDEHWNELAQSLDSSQTPLDDYAERSIGTTWNISYEAILRSDPHAAHLLVLCSFLDNKDIWFDMFTDVVQSGDLEEVRSTWLGDIVTHEMSFHKAMRLLRNYSLVDVVQLTSSYSIHAVVHTWAFHAQAEQCDVALGLYACAAIGYRVPFQEKRGSAGLQRRLLPHAQACRRWLLEKHDILTMTDETQSIYYFIMHKLGKLYEIQGKLGEAEEMFLRALAGYEKTLGPEHTYTLTSVGNLGNVYKEQGKHAEAEKLLQQALAGFEETLGLEHVSTLTTASNLGTLYRIWGKLDEAEEMHLRALAGREKQLGPEHISTLTTVSNLGNVYRIQGKFDEAEKLLHRALAGREEQLGSEHIFTLDTVAALGILCIDQGKLDEAEKLLQQALAGFTEALGREHSFTINVLENLDDIDRIRQANSVGGNVPASAGRV